MIKFFRKIRQNLVSAGKTGKYLKYALGEIVLVVIGILIALSINNWNTNKANEEQAYNQLLEVQKEILNNIIEFDNSSSFYYEKLRDVRRVFSDSLTIEDYQSNPFLSRIISTRRSVLTQNEAFNKFAQNADNLPDRYKPLISEIKELYNQRRFEVQFAYLLNQSDQYFDFIEDFSESRYLQDYDAYYQFLLTSKDYKNKLATFSYVLDDLAPHLATKKYDAIALYKKMLALGFPDDDMDKIETMYQDLTAELARPFIGIYTNTLDTMSISLIDNEVILRVRSTGRNLSLIMSDSSTLFTSGWYLEFNDDKSEFYFLLERLNQHYKRIPENGF